MGYEALARGPAGTGLERPDLLFEAARRADLEAQLDWVCKTVAVRGAIEARLAPPLSLFINSEPRAAGALMPPSFAESWATAKLLYMQLIFEVTERAVTSRPAELLGSVEYLRSLGWGIALDDVGTDPGSLALLPYLRPDVIKLDMRVLHAPDRDLGEVVLAVNAESERSGAAVLAEGIETEEHLDLAKTFGAQLGQGWLFGRPEPLPDRFSTAGSEIRIQHYEPHDPETPFQYLSKRVRVRRASAQQLKGVSQLLEERAAGLPYPPALVAAFQHRDRLTPDAAKRYEELARRLPFVAVLGEQIANEPLPGVRGARLQADDPLAREWLISVISPYLGFLLTARELDPADDGRMFEVAITFDRQRAVEGSTLLLGRLVSTESLSENLDGLVDFASAMQTALAEGGSTEAMVRPLLQTMSRITGLESTFLSRVRDGNYEIRFSDNNGVLDVPEGAHVPWPQAICKRAIDADRQSFNDVQSELLDAVGADGSGFRGFVTCPIVLDDGRVVGTLCGASSVSGAVAADQLEMVKSFAAIIAERLQHEDLEQAPAP